MALVAVAQILQGRRTLGRARKGKKLLTSCSIGDSKLPDQLLSSVPRTIETWNTGNMDGTLFFTFLIPIAQNIKECSFNIYSSFADFK